MMTLTRDIRQVIDNLEPIIKAECPSCGEYTDFSFLKDQCWPSEIAELLGVAVGSISALRDRCLKKLFAALERELAA